MRKIGIALAILGGVLILALGAVWVLANPNSHRELIQSQLEAQLGRKVTLGDMSLGFLPLRFQVESPVIAEDPAIEAKEPFIRAEKLDVRVGLLALLRGNIQVHSLELRRPHVELVRTKQGVWNFSTLASMSAPAAAAPTGNAPTSSRGFSLDRLSILDGQVAVTDLQQKRSRTVYDHIDLTLTDFSPSKPFAFDLAAHVQGEGAQEMRISGEAGPIAAGNPADTPFRGTLKLNQVGIGGLLKFLDSSSTAQVEGILSGESSLASNSGAVTTNGKLKLDKARLNKVDIGYPIAFDYSMKAKIADGTVAIDNATVLLGQTPLAVSGVLNTASTPVRVDLKIKSGDVSIAEIARLCSAFGIAFAPGSTVTGRVRADVQAKGPATQPALTGAVAGRELHISGQGIPQPVDVKSIDLALSPTAIQSNEFQATSGKTTVMGRFAMLQYSSNSPSVDVQLRAPNATLPEIQSLAKAYGVTGLDQLSGEGGLNFDLRAKGPLQSLTAASATHALNGVINLDFSPLKVLGFDTTHELAKLGGFASSLTEQNATDIIRIAGKILVKDGVAQSDDMKAQLGVGNLAATGTADLATEALNLKLSAIFSKAFSEKAAKTRTGDFLNVAFANNAGEIVLPALVTGSFVKPKFSPDLKTLAQLQKQKYIPTLDNPTDAVTNVLGILKGKNKANDTTAAPDQPAAPKQGGLKGILDALGRKKDESK